MSKDNQLNSAVVKLTGASALAKVELEAYESYKVKSIRTLMVFVFSLVILGGCSVAPSFDSPTKPRPSSLVMFEDYPNTRTFTELSIQPAHYPRRAQFNGVEGAVVIRFGIDKEGNTFNLEVIYSDANEEWSKSFQFVSMKSVSNFKYRPSTYKGTPVDTYDATYLVTFCNSGEDRTSLSYRAEACESKPARQEVISALNTPKPSFNLQ